MLSHDLWLSRLLSLLLSTLDVIRHRLPNVGRRGADSRPHWRCCFTERIKQPTTRVNTAAIRVYVCHCGKTRLHPSPDAPVKYWRQVKGAVVTYRSTRRQTVEMERSTDGWPIILAWPLLARATHCGSATRAPCATQPDRRYLVVDDDNGDDDDEDEDNDDDEDDDVETTMDGSAREQHRGPEYSATQARQTTVHCG
ncbi:hypothetical protein WN48_04424 [Eufriesea mexicana]|uniref:Secreted protein n=1 Tax=Eufriesea mexicana TaxID=516756 RepID=A0A310SIB2_9HYME|nr:hypothetical protein WN48_04424 [Eufriesea mexicana]